ncbi:MAG: BREX system ATP-binding domain-containing protein, partial [Promethearchaeota archaeon]
IYLEKISIETIDLLEEIGQKLAKIYELAYDINFDDTLLKKTINNIATYSDERMYDIGVKRLFVQDVIKAFNILKRKGKEVNADDIL